jgi:hypothetical protein
MCRTSGAADVNHCEHCESNPVGTFDFIANWWRSWRTRNAARSELDACGGDETAHIPRDIGVSRLELQTLAGRWPEPADLLPRRMWALGLEREQLFQSEPPVLRDLERVCSQCGHEDPYERDLDHDPANRSWRDYCPNTPTFDALRSEAGDRRLLRKPA